MREVKVVEVAGVELKLVRQTGMDTVLTINQTPVTNQEVTELILWLSKEVLGQTSPTLAPFHVPTESQAVTSFTLDRNVATSLESRVARPELVTEIKKVESALKPGEVDPFEGRRAESSVPLKKITDPSQVSMPAGVEVRGGYIEKPISVKL